MAECSDLTLDEFLTWKSDSLRAYLTRRGVSKEQCTKAELAALCFSVSVLQLPKLRSNEEIITDNLASYSSILNKVGIPDPFTIFNNWEDEKSGLSQWPSIFLSDILSFLLTVNTDQAKLYLNQYKIGKAYEYFHCGWLKQVYVVKVKSRPTSTAGPSDLKLLRAKCHPSQKLSDDPHNVWVCAEDNGTILAAYCSCTAGLGQSCNHVAALLFRVEAANSLGISSGTAVGCKWNIPSGSTKVVIPQQLTDIKIRKSTHGKPVQSRPLVNQEKKFYEPLKECKKTDYVKALTEELRDELPNACLYKGTDFNESSQLEPELPSVRKEISTGLIDMSLFDLEQLVKTNPEKGDLPSITKETVNKIQKETVGQNCNPKWSAIRRFRLTSSNFYSIITKSMSQCQGKVVDFKPEIKTILGFARDLSNVKSIKYGRETEPLAKKQYLLKYLKDGHLNVLSEECGIFLSQTHPYLGASPDLLISCSCCGYGLAEFKCMYSVKKCDTCLEFCYCSLPNYLTFQNDKVFLRRKHSYYCQIQGQLAFSDRQWCDLFVYSSNGSFTERILFDPKYFDTVLHTLERFYLTNIIPEILTGNIQSEILRESSITHTTNVMTNTGTYFCPVCNNAVKEVEHIASYKDKSIGCDKCHLWFHFKCVKVTQLSASKLQKWICANCSNANN